MRLKHLILTISHIVTVSAFAAAPDLIITQDGESLKVYHLDVSSSDNIYYTLSEESDAPLHKILKKDVLIIKKSDGTKIDPAASNSPAVDTHEQTEPENPSKHEILTFTATGTFSVDKKGNRIICYNDDRTPVVFFRLLSDRDKILAVTKWQGKGEYSCAVYVIPEYLIVNDERYSVTTIDDEAFFCKSKGGIMTVTFGNNNVNDIVFPRTLKSIGPRAFAQNTGLTRILLPVSLETIGDEAFFRCGITISNFQQIHIPTGVKSIGKNAFKLVGPDRSPRGNFQSYLSRIPPI